MSASTPTGVHDLETVVRDEGCVLVRLGGVLDVRRAGSVRRLVQREIATTSASERVVIDLAELTALDGAGLNAVTAPSFAAARRGADVTVLAPRDGAARRFSDTVGILPIGAS